MAVKTEPGFAVWITGLPSSGKSTLTAALVGELASRGVDVAVLESDVLRRVLTPNAVYSEPERDVFYRSLAYIGKLLVEHGVPVIFDATANRRAYRDHARREVQRFLEVYLDCPLDLCLARDPKGIYQRGQEGKTMHVPGLQTDYEPPEHPDLVIQAERETPQEAARRLMALLLARRYLQPSTAL